MKANVIPLPKEDARLKRKIRAHFRDLGFLRSSDGTLVPPGLDKQSYRALHSHQRQAHLAKHQAWIDNNIDALLKHIASGNSLEPARIRPRIEMVRAGTWQGDLFRLATYYWRIPISEGYGRRMRFLVWDDYHQTLIGLFALGDAVFNLKARDEYIGWDHHRRADALVNLMDAYALGAIPPYNMLLGGKLVASLIRTQEVVDAFSAKYRNSIGIISGERKEAKLVAVTTTSALGRSSVYNRLRLNGTLILEPIGTTTGWGHFHISDDLFVEIRNFLRSHDGVDPDSHAFGQGPNYRLRVIRKGLQLLGLDPDLARHGLTREVFYCPIATNSFQFLRGDHKQARFGKLPTVSETSNAAIARWITGRAERMPTYKDWRREDFRYELKPINVSVTSTQSMRR
jgi:hypothetical protein